MQPSTSSSPPRHPANTEAIFRPRRNRPVEPDAPAPANDDAAKPKAKDAEDEVEALISDVVVEGLLVDKSQDQHLELHKAMLYK
jgi:hypothetical protein